LQSFLIYYLRPSQNRFFFDLEPTLTRSINDPIQVWGNILELIKGSVPKDNFRKWFEPIVPVKLVDQALTIQVPNKFFYEWIESHFLTLLRNCVRKELGDKGKLEYQILMEDYQKPGVIKKSMKSTFDVDDPGAIANPFVIPGIKKIKMEANLSPKYLFEIFTIHSCNSF